VDHDKILPGIYISRIDGDITTFDLRTRRPNMDDYMDNRTMHSVEHMLATLLRNSPIGDSIIYFGPMGCQTGFYLLTRDESPETVRDILIGALRDTVNFTGEMPGAARKECGNYQNLSLEDAKKECAAYLAAIEDKKGDFRYAE
jgi:S-ribosylhomocysteine lyase